MVNTRLCKRSRINPRTPNAFRIVGEPALPGRNSSRILHVREIYPVLLQIVPAFGFVPLIFHYSICTYNNTACQNITAHPSGLWHIDGLTAVIPATTVIPAKAGIQCPKSVVSLRKSSRLQALDSGFRRSGVAVISYAIAQAHPCKNPFPPLLAMTVGQFGLTKWVHVRRQGLSILPLPLWERAGVRGIVCRRIVPYLTPSPSPIKGKGISCKTERPCVRRQGLSVVIARSAATWQSR